MWPSHAEMFLFLCRHCTLFNIQGRASARTWGRLAALLVLKMVLAGNGERTVLLDKTALMTTPCPHQAGHVAVGSSAGQDCNAMLILSKLVNLSSLEVI